MKLFNNVLVYRFTAKPEWVVSGLPQSDLEKYASRDPFSSQLSHLGFVEPAGSEGVYAEKLDVWDPQSGDHYSGQLLQLRNIERHIPAKAVRRAVDSEVQRIENTEQRKVYSSEKQRIKETVLDRMIPNAFLVSSDMNMLICYPYIFIDQTSRSKADAALSLLRDVTGELPVTPLHTQMPPDTQMTVWATQRHIDCPYLQFGNLFKCEDVFEKGSTLSGQNLDLSESDCDSELLQELSQGRMVTELGLTLSDHLNEYRTDFVLTNGKGFKAIKWPVEFHQRALDEVGEDSSKADAHIASMTLVMHGLMRLTNTVVSALGGLRLNNSESDPGNTTDESLSEQAEDDLI